VSRLPYAIGIPLVALIMVGGIGIPFGLLFLEMDERFNPDVALIVALGIALAILGGAILATMMTARESHPTETGVKASTTGYASTAPQPHPRTTGTQEAPRRRGSGGNARKRS
jgi:hypothetical protein